MNKDPNRRRHRFAGEAEVVVAVPKPKAVTVAVSSGSFKASFWRNLFVVVFCCLVSVASFSAFHIFGESIKPVLITSWQQQNSTPLNSVSGDVSGEDFQSNNLTIQHTITFPDQLLVLLKNHHSNSFQLTTTNHLQCLYFPPSSTTPSLSLLPISSHSDETPHRLLLRCPLPPRGFLVSAGDHSHHPPPTQDTHMWNFLTYTALLDRSDNSTIAFVKGLNLRPERLSDPTRFECMFGWSFHSPKYLIATPILSIAQEIVRCKTPLSVVNRAIGNSGDPSNPVMVSVRIKGKTGGLAPTVASPMAVDSLPVLGQKRHLMCVCTMVRNQARFLKEWIAYHSKIGVERWFIYDNNSNDTLADDVHSIHQEGFNVSHHFWPWVKTQEAGFAHCALRARSSCQWVGFIDVDEFLHLPAAPKITLNNILYNHSMNYPSVAELRTPCHSFGPSGHRTAPLDGVMVGYTCRVATPERHKSIVRPEALSPSLVNVVHHFHLRDGFEFVNMDRSKMVINHYKYQVWDVFKEKFYRRVATYVADWQDKENVGSKDRAPGLGTKAVEPPDWPDRFCEVKDTGLRDWVVGTFADPTTGLLPWSQEQLNVVQPKFS